MSDPDSRTGAVVVELNTTDARIVSSNSSSTNDLNSAAPALPPLPDTAIAPVHDYDLIDFGS